MEKVGRNEPCHCGSGKKYKNCHQPIEAVEAKKGMKNKNILIGGLVALFFTILAMVLYLNNQPSNAAPPGEAPAGKVWSPEHGHWHDAG